MSDIIHVRWHKLVELLDRGTVAVNINTLKVKENDPLRQNGSAVFKDDAKLGIRLNDKDAMM